MKWKPHGENTRDKPTFCFGVFWFSGGFGFSCGFWKFWVSEADDEKKNQKLLVIKIFLFVSPRKKKKKKKRKMSMMMMMIMHVWWWWWWWWCVSVGQEVQKKFVCWGSSQNLQFFLSWGSSSSVFDRFQVLFCFVLLLLLVEINVSDYYFFLVNLMRILGSCIFLFPLSLDLHSADLFFLENFSPEMSSLLLSGDLKNWVLLR